MGNPVYRPDNSRYQLIFVPRNENDPFRIIPLIFTSLKDALEYITSAFDVLVYSKVYLHKLDIYENRILLVTTFFDRDDIEEFIENN